MDRALTGFRQVGLKKEIEDAEKAGKQGMESLDARAAKLICLIRYPEELPACPESAGVRMGAGRAANKTGEGWGNRHMGKNRGTQTTRKLPASASSGNRRAAYGLRWRQKSRR